MNRAEGFPESGNPASSQRRYNPTRLRMTTIRVLLLMKSLMQELESLSCDEERMTVEEFRAEGEADTLTDGLPA